MHYFGIPKCPYCGKRVNIIRCWSLKKEGEYKCPRCSGISNIFLSPLVYVFGVLAVFASVVIYFYHKFIADDITWKTLITIAIPFAAFFLLSLFMPYLKKPVIKKAPIKNKMPRGSSIVNQQSAALPQMQLDFSEDEEYLPKIEYQTGPTYLENKDESEYNTKIIERPERTPGQRITRESAERDSLQKTAQYRSGIRNQSASGELPRRPSGNTAGRPVQAPPSGAVPAIQPRRPSENVNPAMPNTAGRPVQAPPSGAVPAVQPRRPSGNATPAMPNTAGRPVQAPPSGAVPAVQPRRPSGSATPAMPNTAGRPVQTSPSGAVQQIQPRNMNVSPNYEPNHSNITRNQTENPLNQSHKNAEKIEEIEISRDFFSKRKKSE